MKQFHKLLTNTTSLVGYIAVLMFIGAYLGGEQTFALDPTFLKGSIIESKGVLSPISTSYNTNGLSNKSITIFMDGRQYEAKIIREIAVSPEFTY